VSIMKHPEWPVIRGYLRIEYYDRDGGHAHPRHRIEVRSSIPSQLREKFLKLTCDCVACAAPIHPIRNRIKGGRATHAGHLYLAVACPLDVKIGCSRGNAANAEYDRIVHEVETHTEKPLELNL